MDLGQGKLSMALGLLQLALALLQLPAGFNPTLSQAACLLSLGKFTLLIARKDI